MANTKPFRPVTVNPAEELLHHQYGIPEDRVHEMIEQITELCEEMERREEIDIPHAVDRLADFANNPQEFTFTVITLMLSIAKRVDV